MLATRWVFIGANTPSWFGFLLGRKKGQGLHVKEAVMSELKDLWKRSL